jgi:tetratricopeptide (TPR) repeat protein
MIDCNVLLDMRGKLGDPSTSEVRTTRALALLMLGRPTEAMADATFAQRMQPSPTHERLRQRTILAARRFDLLQLDWPDEMALLPLGGKRLEADLKAAVAGLDRLARTNREQTFRASLTLAVILAAQGRHDVAKAVASRALVASPHSPRGLLIRARVCAFAGDNAGAIADIDRGLAIQDHEPGLLELRGALLAKAGDHEGALQDFNSAHAWGAVDRIHLFTAASLVALGDDKSAVQEWSLALRRDPELPEAFLGRARSYVKLRDWDRALADLEQAAAWAHNDPRLEVGIVSTYLQCLVTHPGRMMRCVVLAWRAATDIWGARSVPLLRSARLN